MKNKKVLAVQLPAQCPLRCSFCRTPEHGIGDGNAVVHSVLEAIATKPYCEVYLTSNGETGFSKIFGQVLVLAKENSIPVSVLCATDQSIVSGLTRAEISYNEFTELAARKAVQKAKSLNIPVVLSFVDEGNGMVESYKSIARELCVDGILIRSLQNEGRSMKSGGKTFSETKNKHIGVFPVTAYRELQQYGDNADCIDHFGKLVNFLGSETN